MPLIKEKTYTVDDIYALPEDERAELIDGQIYYMAPTTRKHQDVSMELSSQIKPMFVRKVGRVRCMRLLLQCIWMNPQIPMLSRIYRLSVIKIN